MKSDYAALLRQGSALRDEGDLAGAERLYRRAIAAAPRQAEPFHHLAGLARTAGRLDVAERLYKEALARQPGAPATARVLATILLSQGRYDEGFALWEARHAVPAMAKPQLPYPEWRGEPVAGKSLLIWLEQGLGDQIQFARFAPQLAAQGADVTLLCLPPLARLFSAHLGVRVVAAQGAVNFPDPDFWVMACSLAWRMGVEVASIPSAPYLGPMDKAAAPPAGRFRIGLKTTGNPHHENDANRSLSPQAAERLAASLPGEVVDLDPAATGAKDFGDTADLLASLDYVVSVDTAVAHLAGAMGRPGAVLLPATETDWRWLRDRSDSPWYPSLTLYRQPSPGAWDEPLATLVADVSARARASGKVA